MTQFTDVAAADYAAEYILCMRALELSRGQGDGVYGAELDLTRGQMASFLIRLWEDVLDRACPDGAGSPFTDISGNAHETNIECLYALGITKGVTAATYGPQDPLRASQISRVLLRTYQKADQTCSTTSSGDELDDAVDCLHNLRVIPTTTEGRSYDTVIRAQMAVYVVGLWHNLAGKGAPPTPPKRPTTTQPQTPPTSVQPTFTAIATGRHHSCAIRTNGAATCWGDNGFGQTEAPSGKYTTITAGAVHSCAIRHLHRHHRRRAPFVRHPNQRRRHLLGRRIRGRVRAIRQLHRHHNRRRAIMRPPNRRCHHLLGPGEHSDPGGLTRAGEDTSRVLWVLARRVRGWGLLACWFPAGG